MDLTELLALPADALEGGCWMEDGHVKSMAIKKILG